MAVAWPEELAGFEAFFRATGLVCQRHENWTEFGDNRLDCGDGHIGVTAVSERGIWFVCVVDLETNPNAWYDASLLRELLVNQTGGVLSLPEQIAVVQENWAAIADLFSPTRRAGAHARLEALKNERARRLFPELLQEPRADAP